LPSAVQRHLPYIPSLEAEVQEGLDKICKKKMVKPSFDQSSGQMMMGAKGSMPA
jgi:hypothetical protein